MADSPAIQVDIVSDVVCPWCIVGFKQLERALGMTGLGARVRWHPFELNRDMPEEGQDLREHLMGKYGISAEQSRAARARLVALGDELGFIFDYNDRSRMVNTFRAHQLLGWAEAQNLQHPLILALFAAYFTQGRDVSDIGVLSEIAGSVGLDASAARDVLESEAMAKVTREKLDFWVERGVSGVPTMILGQKYMLTGAQDPATYAEVLERCMAEAA